MENGPALDRVVNRLRANLRAADTEIPEAVLQEVADRGFLEAAIRLEHVQADSAHDLLPDFLNRRSLSTPQTRAAAEPALLDRPLDANPQPPEPSDLFDISYMSIRELAGLLRLRRVSPVELTDRMLERIYRYDSQYNVFQLVMERQALEAAREAEREIADGRYKGPLHGVPVAVKDLFAVKGTPTTAGSAILADNVTDYDAAAVERLRAAGAVIVGKTKMSEFAYMAGSYNPHYGSTRNPWNPERDTGGSSSGSAVAVACGLAYGALGSDTGGSIRVPSSFCSLVGLKPTFGLVSLRGVYPLAWSLDHAGPMTRNVHDAALMLEAIAGRDDRDPRTQALGIPGYREYLEGDLEIWVGRLRIGVLPESDPYIQKADPDVLARWRDGVAALEGRGAGIVELGLPEISALPLLNTAILQMEAAALHRENVRERFDRLGDFMRVRVLSGFAYGPDAYLRAQRLRAELRARCEAVFDKVDVLAMPTVPTAATDLGTAGSTTYTSPFNVLGWPAITVPVGLTGEGLPVGLQLAAGPWREVLLLRAARVLEMYGHWRGRVPPVPQ